MDDSGPTIQICNRDPIKHLIGHHEITVPLFLNGEYTRHRKRNMRSQIWTLGSNIGKVEAHRDLIVREMQQPGRLHVGDHLLAVIPGYRTADVWRQFKQVNARREWIALNIYSLRSVLA